MTSFDESKVIEQSDISLRQARGNIENIFSRVASHDIQIRNILLNIFEVT